MKRFLAVVLGLFAIAGIARADGGLGAMGSYWAPKGFQDNLGFGGKLTLGGTSFGLEVRGSYFENLKQKAEEGNLALQVIPFEAGLVLRAAGQQVTPYIGGGVGYYFLDGKSSDGLYSVDDEVGWYATGGLEIPLGKSTALFGEALYRQVSGTAHSDSLNNLQGDVNIDLSGLVVNVGFLIKF